MTYGLDVDHFESNNEAIAYISWSKTLVKNIQQKTVKYGFCDGYISKGLFQIVCPFYIKVTLDCNIYAFNIICISTEMLFYLWWDIVSLVARQFYYFIIG